VVSQRFDIAGIGIAVDSRGLSFRDDPRRSVFHSPHAAADIRLGVRCGRLSADDPGRLVFDSEMVWRLYDCGGGDRVFRFWSPTRGALPYKELRIGNDYLEGEIVVNEACRDGELTDPLEYPLDELLVVHRLGRGLGCELHGCGIVDRDGSGWLFVGHSGAGKSTLARLWSGRDVTVLSDDRIVVRPDGDGVRMYGTPWHGEAGFAVATSAPLAGVLVLEHGLDNRVEELSAVAAVAELMARAFVPYHDAEAVGTAVDVLTRVATSLPCCRFQFTPDDLAVRCLERWMGLTDAA
jgi:hypothetical protein